MYFTFLSKKQNQKALCPASLERGSHCHKTPK